MRLIKKLALVTTIILIISIAIPSHVLAQSASVSAPSTIDPGASSSASVSISATEIGSFQLTISCDTGGVLNFDSISPGTGPSGFTIMANLTGPSSASIVGFMSTDPITGGLTVASIPFTAVGAPGSSTNINISGNLYDAAGDPIPGITFTGAPVQINIPPTQYTLTILTSGSGSTTGAGVYNEGVDAPITATPAGGWQFVNWTGDTVDDPNSDSTFITMDANKTITANFTQLPTYTLTINTIGNGSTTGAGTYDEGTVVPISATPDTGWNFVNWTGDVTWVADVNSDNTTITMNDNYTITANFTQLPIYTLTMAVNGNGTTDPPVGLHDYPEGTVVPISATPDPGWQFDEWTGDVADPNSNITTVTMDSDKTVTAVFSQVPPVTLTMAVNGNGTTDPLVGTHTYPAGTVVDITATPDTGWEFVNWTGDVADPISATTTVTMDSDKTITANFKPEGEVALTMAVNGNGSTIPEVGTHSYPKNTVVDITAIPDTGWQFDVWTGDVADPNSDTTTVTMDVDKTVTANFSLSPDSTPPVISEISASNATRTSVDISWTTDEPSDSQVEYWASPGELTPLDETLVTEHLVHLTGLNPVTTYHYKAMSRDETGNLAVSGEFTFTTLGTPATFTTSDWDISLTKVDTGREVTISFLITNNGELAGSYEVAFTVNGVVEATEELILDAGASEEITFTTTKDAVGAYLVTINGLSFSFEIEEEAPVIPPTKGPNWWLIIGIIAGVALLAIYIILLARRGKLKAIRWPLPAMRARPREEVADILAKARMEAEVAEERAKMIRAEEREGEPAEGEAWEAAEKAKIAAAEAREKWARMEAEAKAKQEAEEAKKAREAEKKAKKEAKKKARPIEVEKLAGRLTVTALAAEKLRDALQAKTTDPEVGFRLTRSPEKPSQLKMTLDKEKEGDQVVESEGVRILILGPELVSSLEGMVIDYQETPQGAGFAISKRAPGK